MDPALSTSTRKRSWPVLSACKQLSTVALKSATSASALSTLLHKRKTLASCNDCSLPVTAYSRERTLNCSSNRRLSASPATSERDSKGGRFWRMLSPSPCISPGVFGRAIVTTEGQRLKPEFIPSGSIVLKTIDKRALIWWAMSVDGEGIPPFKICRSLDFEIPSRAGSFSRTTDAQPSEDRSKAICIRSPKDFASLDGNRIVEI
jgi:hypothetical protein